MCRRGDHERVRVKIPAHLSNTGEPRWKDCGIDRCIAPIVRALQEGGIDMGGSCCGHHGEFPGNIILQDGRVLLVLPDDGAIRGWKKGVDLVVKLKPAESA